MKPAEQISNALLDGSENLKGFLKRHNLKAGWIGQQLLELGFKELHIDPPKYLLKYNSKRTENTVVSFWMTLYREVGEGELVDELEVQVLQQKPHKVTLKRVFPFQITNRSVMRGYVKELEQTIQAITVQAANNPYIDDVTIFTLNTLRYFEQRVAQLK